MLSGFPLDFIVPLGENSFVSFFSGDGVDVLFNLGALGESNFASSSSSCSTNYFEAGLSILGFSYSLKDLMLGFSGDCFT